MIGVKDIERIIIGEVQEYIPLSSVFTTDDIPEGKVTEERIVIHCKTRSTETFFDKCFVEVNWCVPDIDGAPNSSRLREVERIMLGGFDTVGCYDDSYFRYGISSEEVLSSELECHYVNVRLLFEILNVK